MCLVLDLDDTLFLERDYVCSGFEHVDRWLERNFQISGFTEKAIAEFEAGRRGNTFDRVLSGLAVPVDPDRIRRMVQIYRRHQPAISPVPDAISCLDHWRTRWPMALISDGAVASQRRKLSALGLEPYFKPIVFTSVWGARYAKPHRRAFQLVQSHFSSSTRFIYVADNPVKDFQAPLSLGWMTARIRHAGGLHFTREAAEGFQPHFEVSTLSALTPILNEFLNR